MMADAEHVGRLKRSIEEWNQWRLDCPTILPDLRSANLNNVDLNNIKLNNSLLFNVDLSGANLRDADLSHTYINNATLRNTNLSGAYLNKSILNGADLSGACLNNSIFKDADLSGANLRDANVESAYFEGTNLSGVDFNNANLNGANFQSANLSGANLNNANLSGTNLNNANLSGTNLNNANLNGADLIGANLSRADLNNANLSEADLRDADFSYAELRDADLNEVHFGSTLFAWVDLSSVKRLDTAIHDRPSIVDMKSVIFPLDEHTRRFFMRGVGFSDIFIDYLPSLLTTPIPYYSCFISHSSTDARVAKRLYTNLQAEGVRCWLATHDLRPGTPIVRGIEEAIRWHEKLLLVLSEHAVNSSWVEREVDLALHQELERNQDVLFPIRLDNTVLESTAGWARRLHPRHIGDFTQWQDEDAYREAFINLLRHLKSNPPNTLKNAP